MNCICKNILKIIILILIAFAIFTATNKVNAATKLNELTLKLNKTTLTLTEGSEYIIVATTNVNKVNWTINNPKIIRGQSNGGKKIKIKALKNGTATITAEVDGGKKVVCKVTVTKKDQEQQKYTADDFEVTCNRKFEPGEEVNITDLTIKLRR